jgi:hypothetical protein
MKIRFLILASAGAFLVSLLFFLTDMPQKIGYAGTWSTVALSTIMTFAFCYYGLYGRKPRPSDRNHKTNTPLE